MERIAIDKPSDSLLQFMNKYYALTDPLWQSTNYVVYAPFFDYLQPCDELDTARKQPSSSKTDALHTEVSILVLLHLTTYFVVFVS